MRTPYCVAQGFIPEDGDTPFYLISPIKIYRLKKEKVFFLRLVEVNIVLQIVESASWQPSMNIILHEFITKVDKRINANK